MFATAADGYLALLAASAEVGAEALKLGMTEASKVGRAAKEAAKAPEDERQRAIEAAAVALYEAQVRQLKAWAAAAPLFEQSFLSYFDDRRRR